MVDLVLLVRNPCTHDARVVRAARLATDLGLTAAIVAVTSSDVTRREGRAGEVPVLRLSPTSPLARLRNLVNQRTREVGDPGRTIGPDALSSADAHATPLVWIHRRLVTLDYYRRAARLIRRLRPAVVHCNDYNTMWVGVYARLRFGAAVVYDTHELWPDRNRRPEARWWLLACEWLFTRAAHAVITPSPAYADRIAKRYRRPRPTVVRNVPETTPTPAISAERATERRVVYAGGLLPGRGLEDSIRALARMESHPKLELIGPVRPGYAADLRRLAAELGVSGRVSIPGPVPSDELVGRLAGAELGLVLIEPTCLSYELTLPNKLFELIHARVPVLATDLPAIADVVRSHEVGEVVPPGDVDAIARTADEMMTRGATGYQAKLARAITALSWDREQDILADVYRHLSPRLATRNASH